ncbi:hypothetical protein GM921_08285 [Pedobacter sp. LMG 31464]|uniref:SnoaL-like domain-containing protein n=1 Tax=Pedobacter planticolens TaxID=2679964 RepID=A0A923E0Z1_9SPHI|nr:hypothetical protein [Pedobacter planticolens]MBB2145477.1 hypothetical protein [Pedobacter planticolens]
MKQLSFLLLITLLFVGCQSKDAKTTAKVDTTNYPYTSKKAYNWEMNSDSKNMIIAMNALKAFASKDTAALKPLIADSIHLSVDGYELNGTRAEFLKAAQQEMDKYNSISINMDDYESVVSADKTEEWVSLWYTQHSEGKDGKKGSVNMFNDIKIEKGKVTKWNEYVRHAMEK